LRSRLPHRVAGNAQTQRKEKHLFSSNRSSALPAFDS
jgi:hypothetical protein